MRPITRAFSFSVLFNSVFYSCAICVGIFTYTRQGTPRLSRLNSSAFLPFPCGTSPENAQSNRKTNRCFQTCTPISNDPSGRFTDIKQACVSSCEEGDAADSSLFLFSFGVCIPCSEGQPLPLALSPFRRLLTRKTTARNPVSVSL